MRIRQSSLLMFKGVYPKEVAPSFLRVGPSVRSSSPPGIAPISVEDLQGIEGWIDNLAVVRSNQRRVYSRFFAIGVTTAVLYFFPTLFGGLTLLPSLGLSAYFLFVTRQWFQVRAMQKEAAGNKPQFLASIENETLHLLLPFLHSFADLTRLIEDKKEVFKIRQLCRESLRLGRALELMHETGLPLEDLSEGRALLKARQAEKSRHLIEPKGFALFDQGLNFLGGVVGGYHRNKQEIVERSLFLSKAIEAYLHPTDPGK